MKHPGSGFTSTSTFLRNAALLLLTAAAIAAFFFLAEDLRADGLCILRLTTGIPCPGCGMTRAALAVFRGEFDRAFSYHPLVFVLPLLLPVLLRAVFPRPFARVLERFRIPMKPYLRAENICVWGMLVLFVVVYAVRLWMGWNGIAYG
ncbi:MAG: DUF2752 domain-containing protein [Clostridia bacterium]|nr:DUF2752 domain-containing protein [Clostridia bacterium]